MSTAKEWKTIDYLATSALLAASVRSCHISKKASVETHGPVAAQFKGDPLKGQVQVRRVPRPVPIEPVIGPMPKFVEHASLLEAAQAITDLDSLDECYRRFAKSLEVELGAYHGALNQPKLLSATRSPP